MGIHGNMPLHNYKLKHLMLDTWRLGFLKTFIQLHVMQLSSLVRLTLAQKITLNHINT